jgi:predicted house-cleaning noncanonical NTP pyrophosphatase (MazG superfamily)
MEYNKLVRDRIPEIITNKGAIPITHIADNQEFIEKLEEKLQEEVNEFLESKNTEELADILEVVHAICKTKNVSIEDLEKIRKLKAEERGAFAKKIILERTE